LLLVVAALGPMGSGAQVAPGPFRYDERSGRCHGVDGREGHSPGSRAVLERTGHGECADFSARGLNLTYLQLTGANLRGARFTGVPWYLGSIRDSDLTGADLSHTTGQMEYRGSRLRGASLAGADLTYADLEGVDLDGADLRGARFGPHTRLPFDRDVALQRGMLFAAAP
jgi:hypothetical protein